MTYGSVCSGIEAATVAWEPLCWEAAFYSEIEPFPCAVLQHHYPQTPNHGDMTKYKEWPSANVDVLVGGTPCQSFSVAGLRKGLADPRGNLMLIFGAIASKYRPTWLVWENVPGVLSSNGGRDFGTFLGMLAELGYGFSYRVLDAQYFGVAQRRRRVFVVGHLGDWRPAAAVLFERESLSGNPAPRREAGQEAAGGACFGIDEECNVSKNHYGPLLRGGQGGTRQAVAVLSSGQANAEITKDVSLTLNCNRDGAPICFHATQDPVTSDRTAFALGETVQQAVAIRTAQTSSNGHGFSNETAYTLDQANGQAVALPINTQIATRGDKMGEGTGFGIGEDGDPSFTLQAAHSHAVAFTQNQAGDVLTNEVMHSLATNQNATGRNAANVMTGMQVRRLTPVECERLQGFPDNYTRIPWRNKPPENCPDGPRYKALGNSMAVPVMRWIGERIEHVTPLMEAM